MDFRKHPDAADVTIPKPELLVVAYGMRPSPMWHLSLHECATHWNPSQDIDGETWTVRWHSRRVPVCPKFTPSYYNAGPSSALPIWACRCWAMLVKHKPWVQDMTMLWNGLNLPLEAQALLNQPPSQKLLDQITQTYPTKATEASEMLVQLQQGTAPNAGYTRG